MTTAHGIAPLPSCHGSPKAGQMPPNAFATTRTVKTGGIPLCERGDVSWAVRRMSSIPVREAALLPHTLQTRLPRANHEKQAAETP